MSDSVISWTMQSLESPGQNTGVGSPSFLQGIFPTQGSNPGLLHCRQNLYHLSHKGSHKLAEWIQKQEPHICCLQEIHFRPQDTYRLKVRGWKNIFHANGKQKKAGVAILISDKTDLKIKKITIDKEGYYIMITGSIQEENITILNIYAPNIGAPQYIRQTLTDIKGENDSNRIIEEDFNSPLTPMDRSSKQKINNETQVLNDTLDEMDFIDFSRTFHTNAEEHTFSSSHGTFSIRPHLGSHIIPQ